jgi:protein transport protein SEC61 subunit alpha
VPRLALQGFRVEIKLVRKNVRGNDQRYPIKLFYTSNIPIILQTALVSNLYFFSQLLHKRFPTNFIVGLLGKWQEIPNSGGQSVPTGGIAYFVSPPHRCVCLCLCLCLCVSVCLCVCVC